MEQIQTFIHKAKNKEIRRWASAKETDESDCAPFMESFSDVPGSENWEPLMDVSWLPLWKESKEIKLSTNTCWKLAFKEGIVIQPKKDKTTQ